MFGTEFEFRGTEMDIRLADGDWESIISVQGPPRVVHHEGMQKKRDYPPNLYFQQFYWKYHKTMNDYFSRCCMMLSEGEFVSDLLVIHTIGSAWAKLLEVRRIESKIAQRQVR